MNIKKTMILSITHTIVLIIGFAAGIYTLPILTAPDSPTVSEIQAKANNAIFSAEFIRDLTDSDALHWGEGSLTLSNEAITFQGKLAPGPDYKLYLSPKFVQTEDEFERLKSSMVPVGDIKTFDGFIVNLDSNIDIEDYSAVIVWCESFGEFITAATYR